MSKPQRRRNSVLTAIDEDENKLKIMPINPVEEITGKNHTDIQTKVNPIKSAFDIAYNSEVLEQIVVARPKRKSIVIMASGERMIADENATILDEAALKKKQAEERKLKKQLDNKSESEVRTRTLEEADAMFANIDNFIEATTEISTSTVKESQRRASLTHATEEFRRASLGLALQDISPVKTGGRRGSDAMSNAMAAYRRTSEVGATLRNNGSTNALTSSSSITDARRGFRNMRTAYMSTNNLIDIIHEEEEHHNHHKRQSENKEHRESLFKEGNAEEKNDKQPQAQELHQGNPVLIAQSADADNSHHEQQQAHMPAIINEAGLQNSVNQDDNNDEKSGVEEGQHTSYPNGLAPRPSISARRSMENLDTSEFPNSVRHSSLSGKPSVKVISSSVFAEIPDIRKTNITQRKSISSNPVLSAINTSRRSTLNIAAIENGIDGTSSGKGSIESNVLNASLVEVQQNSLADIIEAKNAYENPLTRPSLFPQRTIFDIVYKRREVKTNPDPWVRSQTQRFPKLKKTKVGFYNVTKAYEDHHSIGLGASSLKSNVPRFQSPTKKGKKPLTKLSLPYTSKQIGLYKDLATESNEEYRAPEENTWIYHLAQKLNRKLPPLVHPVDSFNSLNPYLFRSPLTLGSKADDRFMMAAKSKSKTKELSQYDYLGALVAETKSTASARRYSKVINTIRKKILSLNSQ